MNKMEKDSILILWNSNNGSEKYSNNNLSNKIDYKMVLRTNNHISISVENRKNQIDSQFHFSTKQFKKMSN